MTLMYSDRQLIIVVGDDEVQSAERTPVEVSKGKATQSLLIPTVVGGTGVAVPLVAVGVASAALPFGDGENPESGPRTPTCRISWSRAARRSA